MNNKHLLCITGLTPQVVTETLYAMYQAGQTLPARIHILTTAAGAERARLTLIKDGWLDRFFSDHKLPQLAQTVLNIELLRNAEGEPLQDIRNQQDNQSMADAISEKIRQLTADPTNSLHVSIAGGRKTMGFYAGYALSLYGRPQDQLSHVLISAQYESHPQFYYPTPYPKIIYANDKTSTPLDTQQAEVILADIAFVRLRHGLDERLLNGKSSFSESVQRAQQSFAPAKLLINLKKRQLFAHQQQIKLKPVDMAFYYWVLQRHLIQQLPLYCPADGAPNQEYAQDFIKHYQHIAGEMNMAERTLKALEKGMEKAFFEQHKSSVNSTIKKALDIHAGNFLIQPQGKRPYTQYVIKLEQHQIEYQEEK